MPQLQSLLRQVAVEQTIGNGFVAVENIVIDSRKTTAGSLFVALRGTQVDGHAFIDKAITLGAVAVLCEEAPATPAPDVTYIVVADSAQAMGFVAAHFYDQPARKLKLVGVTGTNGKTSTVSLLFHLFRKLGHHVGLLSTVQNQIDDQIIPSTHTTPDAVTLNALLAEMVRKGCTYCFMEVSSHAVVQHRITGLYFAGGIFTNITHDHLDFHVTFDNYIRAKKGFFDQLPADAFALVNIDDRRGAVMLQNTAARRETYSLQTLASFKGKVLDNSFFGLQMDIDGREVHLQLIGRFNAYNNLGVYGAAVLLDEDPNEVLAILSAQKAPPGRFEQVISDNQIVGIVDYAHTPDALQNVLETITSLRQGNEQIITVVGCGGNRDATKRPLMAQIACKFSTKVILTSDNPRLEDPETILEQMQAGIPPIDFKKTKTIQDRQRAIQYAVSLANPHDVVLVAGKGHETYQEIAGVKHDFDDRTELKKAFGSK